MTDESKRSRTFELKRRLLRRAWDGESKLAKDGAAMIKLIQMRMAQCGIADDHADLLNECLLLNLDQPRSVQMLNALAVHEGGDVRFSNTDGHNTLH